MNEVVQPNPEETIAEFCLEAWCNVRTSVHGGMTSVRISLRMLRSGGGSGSRSIFAVRCAKLTRLLRLSLWNFRKIELKAVAQVLRGLGISDSRWKVNTPTTSATVTLE